MRTYKAAIWAVFCFVFMLIASRPLDDFDLFSQLVLGNDLLRAGLRVSVSPLVYSVIPPAGLGIGWLAQIILAWIADNFSLLALAYLNAAAFAAAITLPLMQLAKEDSRAAGGAVKALAALATGVISYFLLASSTSVRPQLFAVLACSFVLTQILRGLSLLRVISIFLVAIFWQNTHPSLIVGIVLLAAFSPLALASSSQSRSLSDLLKKVLLLALLGFGLCALLFSTPLGSGLFTLSQQNYFNSRHIFHISEWQPAWHASVRGALIPFWVLAPLGVLSVFFKALRPRFSFVLPNIVFILLTLLSARFVLFYALASIPFWFELTGALFQRCSHERLVRATPVFILALCAIGVSVRILTLWDDPLRKLPLAGIKALQAALSDGKVFNYREWAGPLEYFSGERYQVAIDGRLYLYSNTLAVQYLRASGSLLEFERSGFNPKESSNGVNAFFLEPLFNRALIAELRADAAWRLIYADDQAAVFVRSQS